MQWHRGGSRSGTALALLALGFAAGTLAPHASAYTDFAGERMLQELTLIRRELAGIRQELEKVQRDRDKLDAAVSAEKVGRDG